jgi:succinyl-diaminopimelate desuccinylase
VSDSCDPGAFRDDVLELAGALIRRRSVTPDDAGCQDLLAERLAAAGFRIERTRFGADDHPVDNLWARLGDDEPLLVFLGHTDVVPPGPESEWQHPPFAADVTDGVLWGRGAADMKGSVAAMTVAAERYAARRDAGAGGGSIGILLTSDEEGPAIDGIRRMVEWLGDRGEHITYCVVGEPSCDQRLGDTLRVGRRGTLSGELRVDGIQGHVAYPQRARNPVHEFAPALAELTTKQWDAGDEDFPPTTFQISNIHAGTGAENVIPGAAHVCFNFRYGPAQTVASLDTAVRAILDRHGLDYRLDWRHGGMPFRTPAGRLRSALADCVRDVTGIDPIHSTAGGTSDGRFVAPTGAEVIEFGPRNATIHQIDEHVAVDDLAATAVIHYQLACRLLG